MIRMMKQSSSLVKWWDQSSSTMGSVVASKCHLLIDKQAWKVEKNSKMLPNGNSQEFSVRPWPTGVWTLIDAPQHIKFSWPLYNILTASLHGALWVASRPVFWRFTSQKIWTSRNFICLSTTTVTLITAVTYTAVTSVTYIAVMCTVVTVVTYTAVTAVTYTVFASTWHSIR